ncbi:MAG: glutathione S-transferase family protein [Rhodospirillaceae bacterium]|nr:glutathione S-transferase family protein [Rhodospirillaceae bacterium]
MITLYGKAASRTSRNLWALTELGVPYKHIPFDYLKGDTKTPEFLAINPAGKVPALTDDGVVMTESLAMNIYIAQTYGAGSLWPTDKGAQAKCLQWTLWAATELEPLAVGRLIEFVFKKEHERDLKNVETLAERTKAPLKVLEAALSKAPYLAGGTFTIADLNVAAVADYLVRTQFDTTPWPATHKWLTDCLARPANQKVNAMKAVA